MRYLGTNYELGKVVPKNLTKACNWYQKAVDAQDTTAQSYLNDLKKEGKCKR
jgi:TPR repeat protein